VKTLIPVGQYYPQGQDDFQKENPIDDKHRLSPHPLPVPVEDFIKVPFGRTFSIKPVQQSRIEKAP